jgi:aspartyl-tRNA(Asn)/glutamyl-tRNA(Gln) amidotransferase subunit A
MNYSADIHTTLELIGAGRAIPTALMKSSIEIAQSPACQHAFISTRFDRAMAEVSSGQMDHRPLSGLAVSVKDLFDVRGDVTTAGSRVLAHAEIADEDCVAVKRLKLAGGVILGRTNMSEFAYSGVGTNPHFDTPANPCSATERRIPGGSSSGAAVSVATGAVFVGLGSDTGGSIRIPAALNGIVGFKSTASLVPTQGALPLSTTLDTVCAITRSVRDAAVVHEILSSRKVRRSSASLQDYRLGVARTLMLENLDPTVGKAWDRTVALLSRTGADIREVDIPEMLDLAELQATGGFSAAESYAWHHRHLHRQPDDYDPRVKTRILRGATMSAREYIDLHTARSKWIQTMSKTVQQFDVMISPTVPIVAPLISSVAPGAERDQAFFTVNGQLLRNPSMVNMYDGCAISIPCHRAGELPVGLMIWSSGMCDDTVLNVARQIELMLDHEIPERRKP